MWDKGHIINSAKIDMGTEHIPTNNETYTATKHQK